MAKSDLEGLSNRAEKGQRAVKSLSSAFADLSKNGRLTSTSINQFAQALGAVHPVAGLAAAGVGMIVGQGERLRQLELDQLMYQVAAGASAASLNADILIASIKAGTGESGKFRERLEELAKVNVLISNRTKMLDADLSRLAKTLADGGMTQQQYNDQVEFFTNLTGKSIRALEERRLKLETQTEATRTARKENERYMSDYDRHIAIMRAVARVEQDRAGFLREIEAAARSARDASAGSSFELELQEKILEDQNAAYLRQQAIVDALGQTIAHSIGEVGAAAFDRYATAMDRVISNHNAFSASSGRKFQNASADILRALGRDAAARAVYHLAQAAAGSAGVLNTAIYGTPSENLKAAALFGSVAVMAGVGAGALSVKSGGGGGGSSKPSGGGDGGGPVINLTVIGEIDYEGKQRLAAAVADAVNGGG